MFRSNCFLFLLLIIIVPNKSEYILYCPNGRHAIWTFDVTIFRITANCSTPGQPCGNKMGKCNEQNLCCPSTLKMSSKSRLYDRVTNIKFNRIGDDYNNAYRLFELILLSSKNINYDDHARWVFFDDTLRDLFEMPNARFWFSIKNCMQNHGISYAFVPLNATSVTANISAMTILTRKNNSMDSIYICYIATRKEHRRRGLATRLIQQIVQRALDEQQNGIKHITIHVNTLNKIALELYEKCGWRCYDYLPGHLDPEPHHATNDAFALILHLDNVKNVTGLCRDRNAIDIKLSENEQSMKNCRREPAQF